MSNRITVEAVKDAMEKTGMKLTSHKFYTEDGDCGCPQWILYKASDPDLILVDWLERQYGTDYASDFRSGYDFLINGKSHGMKDGYTVRMALLPPGKEGE